MGVLFLVAYGGLQMTVLPTKLQLHCTHDRCIVVEVKTLAYVFGLLALVYLLVVAQTFKR